MPADCNAFVIAAGKRSSAASACTVNAVAIKASPQYRQKRCARVIASFYASRGAIIVPLERRFEGATRLRREKRHGHHIAIV
jgi:hypothetical protein